MEKIYFKKQWYEISESMGESGIMFCSAIIEYQFSGIEPDATSPIFPVFALVKSEIDRQREQTHKAEERRLNTAPLKHAKLVHRSKRVSADTPVNSTAPVNQEDDNHRDANRFVKPTVEQIAEYCKVKNYNVDAQKFYAYYESKGWKIGKSPMKNWQAAIITWTKNNFYSGTAGKTIFQTADKMTSDEVKDYADAMTEEPAW